MWGRGKGTVVVLGAGMDGLALASLAQAWSRGGSSELIEVDCPEVVERKRAALRKAAAAGAGGHDGFLSRLLLEEASGGGHFRLVSADLRDPEGGLAAALAPLLSCIEGEEQEVLFVLEAVLGYLPPERVTALLRCVCGVGRNRKRGRSSPWCLFTLLKIVKSTLQVDRHRCCRPPARRRPHCRHGARGLARLRRPRSASGRCSPRGDGGVCSAGLPFGGAERLG